MTVSNLERERVAGQRAGELARQHLEAQRKLRGLERRCVALECRRIFEERGHGTFALRDLARQLVGHRDHEPLRAGLEIEAVNGSGRHDDQRRRAELRAAVLGKRDAAPLQHENELMQPSVQMRPDLPMMAGAAERDRLDVHEPLVFLVLHLAIQKEGIRSKPAATAATMPPRVKYQDPS